MDYLRFVLSLIVFMAHCQIYVGYFAAYSVALFFVISGYLMTLLMANTYRNKPLIFLLNRLLRLWPSYLIVFLLFVWARLWFTPIYELGSYGIPYGWAYWAQVFMIDSGQSKVIPVVWTLTHEIVFYVLISLGISKTSFRTAIWLVISFFWYCQVTFSSQFPDNYYSLALCSLAYAAGSSGYWMGVEIQKDTEKSAMLGALSYPIFLSHYGIASVAAIWVPVGWPLFWASLSPTLALSWVLVVLVERPIQRYRSRIIGTQNA